MMNVATPTTQNREWAIRPDDLRYTSLADLRKAVDTRKRESWTATPATSELRIVPDESRVALEVYDPTHGQRRQLAPTNFAFGQLSQYAKAPAAYLRTLPPVLAGINLQWGLERNALREDTLILGQTNGHDTLRAMTSTSYGRIWDTDVVRAVEDMNQSGRWTVPAARFMGGNHTGLYASDRDVFMFMVDETRPLDAGGGEILYRGFMAWNSEVGSQTQGFCAFLYRHKCANRMIPQIEHMLRELRIRHTGGAPERFAYEGAAYLKKFSDGSDAELIGHIKKAKELPIPNAAEKGGVEQWLQARGFTAAVAKAGVAAAVAEEGKARSLWDVINGLTAHARTIPHTNDRVELETKAGALMKFAA